MHNEATLEKLRKLLISDLKYLSDEYFRLWKRFLDAYEATGIIEDVTEPNEEIRYFFSAYWDCEEVLKEKCTAVFGKRPRTQLSEEKEKELRLYFHGLNQRENEG